MKKICLAKHTDKLKETACQEEHPGITKGEKKRMCNHKGRKEKDVQTDGMQKTIGRSVHARCAKRQAPVTCSGPSSLSKYERLLLHLEAAHLTCPKGCQGNYAAVGPSRSVPTVMEDEWEAVATEEEMRAFKSEIAALKLQEGSGRKSMDRAGVTAISKVGSLIMSKKIFGKKLQLQSKGGGEKNNGGGGGGGGSDSSESPGSMNAGEEATKTSAFEKLD